jgi:mono/diheme cytochrome c family protein
MKKRILKIAGYIFLILAVLLAGVVSYVKFALPSVAVQDLHITATPERLARGAYLFNVVAGCQDCHSHREEHLFSMPIKEGTVGEGGESFDKEKGFPGTYIAKNITPFHLANWSDGELFRAITSGVSKDGHALFPVMPYLHFGHADKEDIYSIIAYIRTLQPIKKDVPASHSDFPMDIIINTMPAPPDFQTLPDRSNSVLYGKYLVNMASCITCHSQAEKGKIIAGLEFGGGRSFPLPTGGFVRSANITPDVETGIGNWTKEAFIQRFRSYGDSSFKPGIVREGSFNTFMPWTQFAKMTTDDLAAIYDYLRTIKPVKNDVTKFSPKK